MSDDSKAPNDFKNLTGQEPISELCERARAAGMTSKDIATALVLAETMCALAGSVKPSVGTLAHILAGRILTEAVQQLIDHKDGDDTTTDAPRVVAPMPKQEM